MQYLLDTHAFLWFINGDTLLSDKARTIIENPAHDRYVSTASFWEMAIKLNLALLPITIAHTEKIVSLDLYHRDPFDRMLICQAMIDKLTIISADSKFHIYRGIR